MGKLAKVKSGFNRAKLAARAAVKSEKLGGTGHEVLEIGVHAGLALASKNIATVGPIPVKPDVAGVLVGAGMMMLGKGKTRKLGKSVAKGAVNACITRWIADDFTVIQGPIKAPATE